MDGGSNMCRCLLDNRRGRLGVEAFASGVGQGICRGRGKVYPRYIGRGEGGARFGVRRVRTSRVAP